MDRQTDEERRAEDQRWEDRVQIANRDGFLPIGPAPIEVQEAIVRMLRKAHAEEAARHQAREEAVRRQLRESDPRYAETRTRGRR